MTHLLSKIHCHKPPLFSPQGSTLTNKTSNLYFCFPTTIRLPIPAKVFQARTVIRCMASPRRVKMVAKQIMRELSQMLISDTVLQCAVLPEVALGADRYMSSVTTISDVEVSTDLQVAKIYVSVFGDDRGKSVALSGLKSKAKYVRAELGRRMQLRITPEIRFIEDESIERGSRVIEILDMLKEERNRGSKGKGNSSKITSKDQDQDDDDDDDDDDEYDEDYDDDDEVDAEQIIYVD